MAGIFWVNNLQKAKLRNRILLGYSIPIFLSFLAAILVYFQGVKKVEVKAKEIRLYHDHIENVKDLAFSISAMEKSARGYLIGEDKAELNDYEKWDTQFYEQSEYIRQLVKDEVQKENLNEIIELGDKMNEFYRRLISYVELGKREKYLETWSEGKFQQLTGNLSDLVDNFSQEEQKRLAEEEQAQVDALQLLTNIVFGITVISALIAMVSGAVIAGAISKQMEHETSEIATSSSEIAVTMEQQAQNSAQQAAAVQETTTTMNELNTSFHQAKEQAEESADDAQKVLELAQQGQTSVEHTLTGMDHLKAKVEEIVQQTIQLNNKSNQIETITTLVSEIADQTNMLALNAAVEAVRAGEQGKGFGVVANEIRSLADQSQKAVHNINNLIGEIRQDIKQTVKVTKQGIDTVETEVTIAEDMAKAFEGVALSINNIVVKNQQIFMNANHQTLAVQEVLNAMEKINQASQENVKGVSQVTKGTQKLNEALKNLKALIH